jgi:uncharacterized repeat protein (TIGR01451 family)
MRNGGRRLLAIWGVGFRTLLSIAIPGLALVAFAGTALAQTPGGSDTTDERTKPGDSELKVTFAARVCPTYDDIDANLSRNQTQEHLRPLGPNSPYGTLDVVDPLREDQRHPECEPDPRFDLQMGEGVAEDPVTDPLFGALSVVGPESGGKITLRNNTELLDSHGKPTGLEIDGARTVALSEEQADLAAEEEGLWVQGGTPKKPILNPKQFSFGAIRCAFDHARGDNVEWIAYPAGQTHVFCFYYLVREPSETAAITVEKEVVGPGATTTSFPFDGNLSRPGSFPLEAGPGMPASRTFVRDATGDGDPPWQVKELVPEGWRLKDVDCASSSGESETSIDGAEASIRLAAGDEVTCTYTNSLVPPAGGLAIKKVTRGGTGTFGYRIAPVGGGQASTSTATTRSEDVITPATPRLLRLSPGRYAIKETLPSSSRGKWTLESASCNGADQRVRGGDTILVRVRPQRGVSCTFNNRFEPRRGSIRLFKVTKGGVGRVGFLVAPRGADGPAEVRGQIAQTRRPGIPAKARGQSTRGLPLGQYLIQELVRTDTWSLESVRCNGELIPFGRGLTAVALTAEQPHVACTFTNAKVQEPEKPIDPGKPIEPGKPDPTDPTTPTDPARPTEPTAPRPAVPEARLVVSKQATPKALELGETISYRITVTNRGPDIAQDVALWEQGAPALLFKSMTASQGVCRVARDPKGCLLGDIAPGETVRIRARAAPTQAGRITNRVIAASTTANRALASSQASVTVPVVARREIGFTG